jgi:hypothetical protein
MTGEPDDALLARYLLDSCSEDEQSRVEQRVFANDATFDRLRDVEEDLIARHLRGEMAPDERQRFERAYASPPRHDRVLFAKALTHLLAATGAASVIPADRARRTRWRSWMAPPQMRFVIAAAAVVLAIGVVALSWQSAGLRSTLAGVRADNDALRRQRDADRRRLEQLEARASTLTEQLNRERANQSVASDAPRPRPPLALFVLSPGLLRGAREPRRLAVSPSAEAVRLQLDLEPSADAVRCRAVLLGGDGRERWRGEGIRPTPIDAGSAVVVTVPAMTIPDGEYEVVVSDTAGPSAEELGRYYFTIVRR